MKYIVIITSLFLMPLFLNAQEYVDFTTKDDIKFEYMWKKQHPLKKDSPYVLYVKITNNSVDRKLVGFELFYFWNGVTHSRSGYREYCIRSGQTISGKKWNLAFKSEIKTLEEIHDRSFIWEIEKLNIEISDNCNAGLKLKLEPAHEVNHPIKEEKLKDVD